MPDPSCSEVEPPNEFHSVVQTLTDVEQKPSFLPLVEPHPEPWSVSWRPDQLLERQPEINSFLRPITFHAEPLFPLRLRDEQALEEIFEDTQVEDVFIDVCDRLKQLYPEPCWEDDSFNFLSGYL